MNHSATGPLYTLDEARRVLTREKCRTRGHDFDVISVRDLSDPSGVPISVHCPRCGMDWPICQPDRTPPPPPQVPDK